MYKKTESEYQNHPVVIRILEDKPGGGTMGRKSFPDNLDEVPAGIIVGENENGLLQPIKTTKITGVSDADSVVYSAIGHHFKIGDFVAIDGLKGKSVKIKAITTDTFTVTETLGKLSEGDILLQVKGAAEAGKVELIVEPIGVSMSKVNLTIPNQPTGILIRGSVNSIQMPYPLSKTVSEKLELIRFE